MHDLREQVMYSQRYFFHDGRDEFLIDIRILGTVFYFEESKKDLIP